MRLYASDRQLISTALIDGFDAAGLAGLVLRCGYRLERLVSPTLRFDVQVAAVVESAERGDWLDVLVAAAKAANPTNRLIAALPDRFYDDSDPFPAPALDFQRTAGNRIVTTKDGMAMVLVSAENTPPFWIDAQPVTNAAYLRFVQATGHAVPRGWDRLRRLYAGDDAAPVVWVSRLDALRYAAWAGKRLPTAAEVAAARPVVDGELATRHDGDGLTPFAAPHIGLRMAV